MLISFEGIDRSGKSTQILLLRDWLEQHGRKSIIVREPGGTPISERIRDLLLDTRSEEMTPVAEMLLFSAARAQLVHEVIRPALAAGTHVLADRFFDSTLAYQGYGRGLDIDALREVQVLATGGLEPDLTLFFDLEFEESQLRKSTREEDPDRIESADRPFFERVRKGYHDLAAQYSDRFVIIDASGSIQEVFDTIRGILSDRDGIRTPESDRTS